jgi:hypothetical protein
VPHHYPAGQQPESWVPGSIVFTHSKGIVGWLIRLGQFLRLCGLRPWRWKNHPNRKWCHFNHVAVVMNSQGGIVEALADGVVMSNMTKYLNTEYVVWEPDNPLWDYKEGLQWVAYEYSRHAAYGWVSIASIVAQLLTGSKISVGYRDSIICSAVGAKYLEHCGACLPYDDPRNVMPAELARFVGVSV